MPSGRVVGWSVFAGVVLAAIAGGAAYITLALREKALAEDFSLVQSLIDQKQFDRADTVLQNRLDKGRGKEAWYGDALVLKLDLNEARGDTAKAREAAEMLLDEKRGYRGRPLIRAHGFLGMDALDGANDAAKAEPHFKAILEKAGEDGYGVDLAKLGLLRIRLAAQGPTPEAKQELEELRKANPNSAFMAEIEHVLGAVNMALLYSPYPVGNDQIHELAKGDTIDRLSRNFKIPADLLMRVNQISDPKRLTIGRRLKIPDVEFSIEVNKSNNTLTLLNRGDFFKRYLVRTGKVDYLTPVGDFKVINKKKDPAWTDPKTNKYYAPGDPTNELGTRWIGFKGASFGIHGTIQPETIGTYASNGCVGMLQPDIEELYDLVREGTPIKITGTVQAPPGGTPGTNS